MTRLTLATLILAALPMMAEDVVGDPSTGKWTNKGIAGPTTYTIRDFQLDINSEELVAIEHSAETVYSFYLKGEKLMKLSADGEILWVSDRVKAFVQEKPCLIWDSGATVPVPTPLHLLYDDMVPFRLPLDPPAKEKP